MIDQQQYDLLRQGVETWNVWRNQHPEILINLTGADLTGAFLDRADLTGARLSKTDLTGAFLFGAHLSEAFLAGAFLTRAHLSEAFLDRADLTGAFLTGADLTGAFLAEAHLSEAHLTSAYFINAHLSGADLTGAFLNGANLSGADLTRADLTGANLSEAHFINADLTGADLTRAHLSEADLTDARVGWTIFGNVDLRTVKGLETVFHKGPSTIGTDTLMRSEGDIPEKFLRRAGLSNTFITYVRSLTQNPIEYYTCFISYSSKDQEFAERLFADLQRKDIRCWYAPEDLKIGDEFRNRIEESIRLYDKLLVILSHQSIQSDWVKTEVEAAFEKEQRQNKLVLFPIKLDDTIMQTTEAWAADIRRRKHIGDFLKWKDHDAYQVAFQRLLRDLQASTIPPITES